MIRTLQERTSIPNCLTQAIDPLLSFRLSTHAPVELLGKPFFPLPGLAVRGREETVEAKLEEIEAQPHLQTHQSEWEIGEGPGDKDEKDVFPQQHEPDQDQADLLAPAEGADSPLAELGLDGAEGNGTGRGRLLLGGLDLPDDDVPRGSGQRLGKLLGLLLGQVLWGGHGELCEGRQEGRRCSCGGIRLLTPT